VNGEVAIDMKHFKQFSLDESTNSANIGPGLDLGELTKLLYDAGGRAVSHGVVQAIGVGGHFTIGGLGPLSRLWGAALDNIEEAEVVLANASIVRASKESYPDVFYAIRGAGAGFGIVTEFKIRTYPSLQESVEFKYEFSFGNSTERANLYLAWQEFVSEPNLTRKFSSRMILTQGVMMILGQFHGSKEEYDQLGLEKRFPGAKSSNVVVLTDWLAMLGHDIQKEAIGSLVKYH
jgi:FAD/FMN-containing dehydrogenase